MKNLADLLESFVAALYLDKGIKYVEAFMEVCFFPRLKVMTYFDTNQKSNLHYTRSITPKRACNEWRGPCPRLSAWATQLQRNGQRWRQATLCPS